MGVEYPITGNPRTFRDKRDLTPESYDTVLRLFQRQLDIDLARPVADRLGPLHVGIQTLTEVSLAGSRSGWTGSALHRLEVAAGVLLGEILVETTNRIPRADLAQLQRRLARSGCRAHA